MLWIKGKVSAINIIQSTILPSVICMLIPLLYVSLKLKGNVSTNNNSTQSDDDVTSSS